MLQPPTNSTDVKQCNSATCTLWYLPKQGHTVHVSHILSLHWVLPICTQIKPQNIYTKQVSLETPSPLPAPHPLHLVHDTMTNSFQDINRNTPSSTCIDHYQLRRLSYPLSHHPHMTLWWFAPESPAIQSHCFPIIPKSTMHTTSCIGSLSYCIIPLPQQWEILTSCTGSISHSHPCTW